MRMPYSSVPPPCPVDDAPCTTCCSPDYQGRSDKRVIVVQQHASPTTIVVRGRHVETFAPPISAAAAVDTFTTAEYRGTRKPRRGPAATVRLDR